MHGLEENICNSYISDKRLVSRICKELLQFNNKKINHKIKNGRTIWIDIPPKKEHKWLNKHRKTCLTSWVIRGMQFKTTMRYYFTPTSMTKIKKSDSNKCEKKFREIGTLILCCWECKMVHPFWVITGQFVKRLNIELSYDPTIPFLVIYPRQLKMCVHT